MPSIDRHSSTDAPLPAGLANICHTRGIAVIEAMPKPNSDADEADAESTVTPIRPAGRLEVTAIPAA